MQIGERVEISAEIVGEYSFQKHIGWKTEEFNIFKMVDPEGRVFVWKTTASIGIDREDARGHWYWEGASKRDTVRIKATVKGVGEYKGEKQIELSRVKCLHIDHAPTIEEIRENERARQLASMREGDILLRMRHSNWEDHYADCEILKGSYDRISGTIQVIVRAGRLKASGTRGKHYAGYQFRAPDGSKCITYRAVDEDHAYRHMIKEYPEYAAWKCDKVYWYK